MKKTTYFKSLMLVLILLVGSGSVAAQYSGMGTFTKITDLAELTDGYYVIVNSGDAFAMNSTNEGKFFTHTAVTPASDVITNPATDIVWKIENNGGGRTIFNESSEKYVSYTGSKNEAHAVDAVTTDNQRWTFTYDAGIFKASNAALTTRMLQYNSGAPRFACYTGSQQDLLLYKLDEVAPTTPTLAVGPVPAMTSNVGTTDTEDITVNGVSLTANITLAVTGTDAALFTLSSASLAPTDGSVSETVTVTYTPTAAGEHAATLTLSSTGADDVVLSLSGVATWAPLADPVATAASDIGITAFTANWDAVIGATEYELSVYEKEGEVVNSTDLFISEYAEGAGGNKKYVEIYNGTGSTIDLSFYSLKRATNGGGWPTSGNAIVTFTELSLPNNATYVIAHNDVDVIGADSYNSNFASWNGDDAIGLFKNDSILIDVFGTPDVDPGTGWEVAGIANATVDKILIRKSSVTSPNTDWVSSAGTSVEDSEWIVSEFTYNSSEQTTDLGTHTFGSQTIAPIAGSPFTVTGATEKTITGLTPSTTYYYTVVASNVNVTSVSSNEITASTLITAISNPVANTSIIAHNGAIRFTAKAGEQVQVYNAIGQQLISRTAVDGLNTIPVNVRGIMVVKVGNRITKLIL